MKKTKGFTLIELLIVIGLISILASIVLINLNSSRNKAMDTAIIMRMNQLAVIAEEWHEEHGNYAAFCNYSQTKIIFNAISSVKKYIFCHADSDQWVACAQLNAFDGRSKAWCIDNSLIRKPIDQIDCKENIKFCPTAE